MPDEPFYLQELPWFLQRLQPITPDVVDAMKPFIGAAMGGTALDPKVKQLITLALDIASGQTLGAQHMAALSRERWGATEDEVAEVVAVTAMHGAMARLAIGSLALEGQTEPTIEELRTAGVQSEITG